MTFCSVAYANNATLRVGVYHNPPKLMLDESGELSGIHGDLLTLIAEREGWSLVPVECVWEKCLNQLDDGRIDILPDIVKTTDRSRLFAFHDEPSLLSWSQLYAAAGADITSLLDLDGKKVAVLSESIEEAYLKDVIFNFDLNTTLIAVSTYTAGFDAVSEGRADAVATNQFLGNRQVERRHIDMTPIMFLPNKLYFSAKLGKNEDVLAAIDAQLLQLKADKSSAYFQIIKNWTSQPSIHDIPGFVWWLLAALVALGLLGFLFIYILRQQVSAKTQALNSSRERLKVILDSVDASIYIKDTTLRYQYANQKAQEFLGVTEEDLLNKTDFDVFDEATAESIRKQDQRVLDTQQRIAKGETNYLPGDETPHHFWSVKVPLYESKGELSGLCGISSDVSDYTHMKKELESLAYFDPLTGLANRRFMMEQISRGFKQFKGDGTDAALILLNIDHFKQINDRYGHAVGDELLTQFGQRLEKELRQKDDAGRLSADEFMVFLEQPRANAELLANDLRERLNVLLDKLTKPYSIGGHLETVSVSMGIALLSDVQSEKEILQAIDLALVQAKQANGPHLQFFNSDLQQRFARQQKVLMALVRAISTDMLTMHYQPQYSLKYGSSDMMCVGYESLIRWHDSELGWVSPGEFIPLAEAEGLMPDIHRIVLRNVLADVRELQKLHDEPIRVAINISASQFKDERFVDDIKALLAMSGVSGSAIDIEITESLLIENIEHTVDVMSQLQHLGFSFSLDDFGTGYASLGYLQRLPLNRLKIDQSFVHELPGNYNDIAIVKTILALGKSLEMDVIAEGIETKEQLDTLTALGCHQYQGYYFAKPMSLANLQRLKGDT
ncbi:EAL domain-containing protein [Idiomarina piscisalsi]|uniref:EAL domain-containing protein n=1 Tax=Idiomarina piscisalsi TaxID=1096243 RepID=UPI0023AAD1E6|nr:EAL domain-containing protein [Idiomarina piscisalsi]